MPDASHDEVETLTLAAEPIDLLTARKKKRGARLFMCALLGFTALGLLCLRLPLLEWSDACDLWVTGNYWVAALLYVVVLGLWSLLIPTAIPIMLAGYYFGFWIGLLATYIATTCSFILAFALTRHFFRDQVVSYLSERPRSKAFIDHLEKAGWKLVVWMRISPLIPFHLQNYCYGASSMSFRTCLLATLLGKIPGVTVTILLGVLIKESTLGFRQIEEIERPWWWQAFLILATIAMIMVTYLIAVAGKKALRPLRGPEHAQENN